MAQEYARSADEYARLYDPVTRTIHQSDRPTQLLWVPSIHYASLLLERGAKEDIERAQDIITYFLGLQVTDEAELYYGRLPIVVGRPASDANGTLFLMPHLVRGVLPHAGKLSAPTAAALNAAVQRAIVAIERRWSEEVFEPHRDSVAYTNVFLLYIQALLLVGLHYKNARLLRTAKAQWARWFNHVSYYGIDEFLSPTYNEVDLEVLENLCRDASDEQWRQQVRQVLDYLVALISAMSHPVLKTQVSGMSRHYRKLEQSDEPQWLTNGSYGSYQILAGVREEYAHRRFPYTAHGRATTVPFCFTTWQEEHAGLGSMTGGVYFIQQIYCLAAVGRDSRQRAMAYLPGVLTTANGYIRQRNATALCVFNRLPNTLYRTVRVVPDECVAGMNGCFGLGITAGWQRHQAGRRLVLSAYGFDLVADAFTLHNGQMMPLELQCVQRKDHDEGGRHCHIPALFDEYVFPADATWFGCLLRIVPEGTAVPEAAWSYSESGRMVTFTADDLAVRLFRQPSGETTELYDDDWRTSPLLDCLASTLWPGQLTAVAANRCRTQGGKPTGAI